MNYSYSDNTASTRYSYRNDLILKLSISIILFGLYIQYSINSYVGFYYGYDEIIYSSGILNGIVRIFTITTFLGAFVLFFNWISGKRKYNYYEFILVVVFVLHFVHLFVFTNSPLSVIFNIGEWGGRYGLVTIMSISLLFYAEEPYYWEYIKNNIKWLTLLSFILCTVFLLTKPEIYMSRAFAYKWLHGFGVGLRLGVFIYLLDEKNKKLLKPLMFIVYVVTMICLQARIYLVDFILQLFFMLIVKMINRIRSRHFNKYLFVSLGTLIAMVAIFFYLNTTLLAYLPQNIQMAMNNFTDRFFEDTRTGQANSFMPLFFRSLPFGVGYNTTSISSGLGENGIDNGYLNAIYIVGIPMVFLGCTLTHLPIIRSIRSKLNEADLSIIGRGLAWIVILSSSTSITFSIEYIFFVIVAGRCLYISRVVSKTIEKEESILLKNH